jgi:hypothetical protein
VENILINLTSDPSGLQPGIDGLVQMQVVDKELADQIKKTNDEFAKQGKAGAEGIKTTGSELQKLVSYFQNLDKMVAGGLAGKSLKDIDKAVSGVSDQFKTLQTVVQASKGKLAELKPNSTEWKTLNDQIQLAQNYLKEFGQTEETAEAKTKSLRQQLRAMREEIAQKQIAGEAGPEVQELIAKAGELDDALKDVSQQISRTGSDTRNIEGFIQLVGTGTQVIAGLSAAQTLLGNDDKDFQQVLIRLNALMLLSNSIQSVQTILQKESSTIRAIENAQRSISVAITNLQTAAESRNIIVRYAAIVAQKALNFAMSSSPIGIVLTAMTALAGVVLYFTSNTTAAAKAQAELNAQLASAGDLLNAELEGMDNANTKIVANLKAQGASDATLTRQTMANTGLRIEARNREIDGLTQQYNDQKFVNKLSAEDYKKLGDKILELQSANQKDVAEVYATGKELERKQYLDGLKSTESYVSSRVDLVKKGSRAELQAQIDGINAAAQLQIKSNPNITSGERVKIESDALRQIAELQYNFDQKRYADEVKSLNSRAALEKEGSIEQRNLELSALDAQKKAELQTSVVVNGQLVQLKELTEKQKAEIGDRYLKISSDKIAETAQKLSQVEISAQISADNARIDKLQFQLGAEASTNNQLLDLKKQLIHDQAQLEIASIDPRVETEESYRNKIRAIYAKELLDKEQLEKDKKAAENQQSFDFDTALYNKNIALNQLILLDEKATNQKKAEARQALSAYSIGLLETEKAKIEQDHADGLLSEEQYQIKKMAIEEKYAQQQIQLKEQLMQYDEQNRMKVFDAEKSLGDAFFDANAQRYQKELDMDQALYDNKIISEKEFNNRKKAIAQQQAADQKAKAIFDIAVDLAKSIFQIQSQAAILGLTPVIGTILQAKALAQIPFLIGEAAVQSGLVLARKYRDGGYIDGPGTSTSDSIPIWASKGEYMVNAASTSKHKDALEAINKGKYEQYLVQYELPKLYQNMSMPDLPEYVQNVTNQSSMNIDYEKLGDVFAQKLAENPQHILSFDENGFHYAVRKGNDLTNYVNKKLTT